MKNLFPLLAALVFAVEALAFEIRTVREEIPESNPVVRTILMSEPTRLSYIAPAGWAAVLKTENKIVYRSQDEKGTLEIKLSANASPGSAAILRESVLKEFENAVVVEEFSTASGTGGGLGIEVEARTPTGHKFTRRLAVFAAPAGSVEISLSARSIRDYHIHWTAFLNSFRVERTR